MKMSAVSFLALGLISVSFGAAAGPMQAGLWEVTMKSDTLKNMPPLSPQQAEQIKKMGLSVPEMRNGGMVSKICISKEMAKSDQPPQIERVQKNCKSKNVQKNGNTQSMDIVCNGSQLKGNGAVKATYASNTSFQSTYDFKGTYRGKPVTHHQETSGQWLGENCGSIKPITMGRK